jgi:hypothetical protein
MQERKSYGTLAASITRSQFSPSTASGRFRFQDRCCKSLVTPGIKVFQGAPAVGEIQTNAGMARSHNLHHMLYVPRTFIFRWNQWLTLGILEPILSKQAPPQAAVYSVQGGNVFTVVAVRRADQRKLRPNCIRTPR